MTTTYVIATHENGTPWGMTSKESFFDPKTHLRTQGDAPGPRVHPKSSNSLTPKHLKKPKKLTTNTGKAQAGSKMTTHDVKSCANCPLAAFEHSEGYRCNHPTKPAEVTYRSEEWFDFPADIAPDDCPLRVESVEIKLIP